MCCTGWGRGWGLLKTLLRKQGEKWSYWGTRGSAQGEIYWVCLVLRPGIGGQSNWDQSDSLWWNNQKALSSNLDLSLCMISLNMDAC